MKHIELSEENIDKLRAAQNAITKLESGGAIVQGSSEHEALTWAVLTLTGEMLLAKRPLTGKDLERAKEVAEKYRNGEYTFPADKQK